MSKKCPLCGEPISKHGTTCRACATKINCRGWRQEIALRVFAETGKKPWLDDEAFYRSLAHGRRKTND